MAALSSNGSINILSTRSLISSCFSLEEAPIKSSYKETEEIKIFELLGIE